MGCHFIAVTTSWQKPCWNLALELPSEAVYQLYTSNRIAFTVKFDYNLCFSKFSPYLCFLYLPSHIVFLNFKLYASSYCLFGLPTSRRQSLGEANGTPLQYSCLENPMDGGAWWAAVHGVVKSWTWLSDFTFTFHFHALEKEMATHSSILAWRVPGMGEPSGLPSMGSHRVGHDWSDTAAAAEDRV